VRRLSPSCTVTHLADWHNGEFLDASDEELALVSYDVHTLPGTARAMIAESRAAVRVVLFSARVRADDIGALARSLADLFSQPDSFDPADLLFLRPSTR
jgi:hypothetical protein